MAKIEIGMMVEIIQGPPGIWPGSPEMMRFIGTITKVKRPSPIYPGSWALEGLEIDPEDGALMTFSEKRLRPINPPQTNPDIEETKEKGVPAWDTCLWSPEKEKVK